MPDQKFYKNILCIHAGNMGDLIMATPAFRALRETFDCRITLLTSKAGGAVTKHLYHIDEVIIQDLPWIKSITSDPSALLKLPEKIKAEEFDAAIIFTDYGQSALPAAMLAYMAGIPHRVAYSRENPHELLTNWIPENESDETNFHQVERNLALVANIGAFASHDLLEVRLMSKNKISLRNKLSWIGIESEQPWIVLNPGVSEENREYPISNWIKMGKLLSKKYNIPLLVTGSKDEKKLTDLIVSGIGQQAFSMAGILSIGEFIGVIAKAQCVVTVNTSTVHVTSAMQVPMVVLSGQTDLKHLPWKTTNYTIMPFSVDNKTADNASGQKNIVYPVPKDVLKAIADIMIIPKTDISQVENVGLLTSKTK